MSTENVSAAPNAGPEAGSGSSDVSASDVVEALRESGEFESDDSDAEDAQDEGDESAGDEPAAEGEGEEPEADEDGPDADDDQPEDKQAKESTYQRQKRKLERAREELAQEQERKARLEAERSEWQEENYIWRQMYEQERASREADIRRFQEQGFRIDPKEVALEQAQRKLQEYQLTQELARQREQAAPQVERERQVQEYKRHLYNESADIAEESGLDQRQLLKAFVFAVDVEGRKDATLQSVAKDILSRRQGVRADGLRAQVRASKDAPRTVRGVSPTSVKRPSYEDTPEDIVQHLRAEGIF
jgi:hypothetical protein